MFNGVMERKSEIEIPDIHVDEFKALLRLDLIFMYSKIFYEA